MALRYLPLVIISLEVEIKYGISTYYNNQIPTNNMIMFLENI